MCLSALAPSPLSRKDSFKFAPEGVWCGTVWCGAMCSYTAIATYTFILQSRKPYWPTRSGLHINTRDKGYIRMSYWSPCSGQLFSDVKKKRLRTAHITPTPQNKRRGGHQQREGLWWLDVTRYQLGRASPTPPGDEGVSGGLSPPHRISRDQVGSTCPCARYQQRELLL